jgi:hypothetical protein
MKIILKKSFVLLFLFFICRCSDECKYVCLYQVIHIVFFQSIQQLRYLNQLLQTMKL